jgi:hypothetical protein
MRLKETPGAKQKRCSGNNSFAVMFAEKRTNFKHVLTAWRQAIDSKYSSEKPVLDRREMADFPRKMRNFDSAHGKNSFGGVGWTWVEIGDHQISTPHSAPKLCSETVTKTNDSSFIILPFC